MTASTSKVQLPTITPADDFAIQPPYFSGSSTDDATTWYKQFEKYIEFRNVTTEERKRAIFQILLRGPAAEWLDVLPQAQKEDWDSMRAAFRLRYMATEALQAKCTKDLFSLRQLPHESVDDFVVKMRKIASTINVDDNLLKNAVLNGLRPNIASAIRMQKPNDLNDILTAGRIAELSATSSAEESLVYQQLADMQVEMRRLTSRMDRMSTYNVDNTRSPSSSPTPTRRVTFEQRRQQPKQWQQPTKQQQSPIFHRSAPGSAQRSTQQQDDRTVKDATCKRCARPMVTHKNNICIAMGKTCVACGKPNHFWQACLSASKPGFGRKPQTNQSVGQPRY